MKTFELKPLTLAIAVVAVPALAQTDSSAPLEEIVVTASYRDSLARALDQKRDAVGSRDVILAEDIGKFPALNLAESLQRIPGVAITRDAGEGRQISVRGLGPDFTRVRINGMEGMSTTGSTDSSGGANRSRAFDFNTFASELFSSMTVHKTAAGELDEGSLGATVDLQTARAFDLADDFTLVTSAQMGYNDLSGKTNPRVAALAGGKNADSTFGWTASVAYSSRESLEEGFSAVRWQNGTQWGACSGCDSSQQAQLDGGDVFHPRIPRYGLLTHDQDRLGLTAGIQWQPTEQTLVSLDALHSKFDASRREEFLSAVSFSRNNATGNQEMDIVDLEIRGNDLVYGEFDNVDVRIENRFDELETKFQQFTLNVEHEFSDTLRGNFFAGTSESNFRNPVQTTIVFDAMNIDGYVYDFRGDSKLPRISYGGMDVRDPGQYEFTEVRDRPNYTDNGFNTVAFNGEWDIDETFRLKSGLSRKVYSFEVFEARRDTTVANIDGFDGPLPVTAANSGTTCFKDTPSGSDKCFVSPNVSAAAAQVNLYSLDATARDADDRAVEETDTGFYVQLDWDTHLADMPLRGNVGVRRVNTDQVSEGIQTVAGEAMRVKVKRDYDDTLPSINVALDPREDVTLRASWSKVMTRPGLGNVTPGGSVDGFNNVVSYGNPFLDPFRADAFDLAVEWYFAQDAVLSLAWFHKDIKSFIFRETVEGVAWSDIGLPNSLLDQVPATPDQDFSVTQFVNGEGGDLSGVELIWQQPITENIGVVTSYTYVDSEVVYPDGSEFIKAPLNGMSKHAYSLTGYYEDDRFSGRLTYAVRDDYQTQIPGRNGNDREWTEGTANLDMALSYQLTDQLKLTFDGINLTNEYNHQLVGSEGRTTVYHQTGRQYFLGAQYQF